MIILCFLYVKYGTNIYIIRNIVLCMYLILGSIVFNGLCIIKNVYAHQKPTSNFKVLLENSEKMKIS